MKSQKGLMLHEEKVVINGNEAIIYFISKV